MELPDKKVVDTIQSRVVTQDEFNYDHLMARPLYSLVSQNDIDEVYRIATSVRLAGNPRKRYDLIDKVMHNRGFRKLSAGTNRVAYTYFEDPSIVVKVAADRTAIMDNPREFVNQNKLKPFCTKVFEVDPSGTMGVFERVKPITSREEYLTVASDVFDMLDMITSKYVLADIGTKFFMNIGIRKNFGVVLLDFPYLYEINDPNSLVCKKPDINSPGGFCGGLIDYDEGFNVLKCNKCGAVYRAQELGSYLKTNKIIMKGTGKMSGVKVNLKFTKGGKTYELGNGSEIDVVKEESSVIKHVEPKKPVEKKDGVLKVSVNNGNKKFSYDVDTTVQNTNTAECNFGTKRIKKSIDRIQNPAHNKDRSRIPFARFAKVNDRNNLIFTVKINNGIFEVLVDPARIPDDAKKLFVPDFENIATSNAELETAKNDIMTLEAKNIDLSEQIKGYISENGTLHEDIEKAAAEISDLNEKIDSITADKNNKLKILDNVIKENDTLKAQIHDLEEKLAAAEGTVNEDIKNKMAELEEANLKFAEAEAEASDKLDKMEVQFENMKEELIACQEENENLRNAIALMQSNEAQAQSESSNEYTIETVEEDYTDEEYDSEEDEVAQSHDSNEVTDTVFYMNAVYAKLKDIIEYTGKKTNYVMDDGTVIDKNVNAVIFRTNDGDFLSDGYDNICVGINLTPLKFDNKEQKTEE